MSVLFVVGDLSFATSGNLPGVGKKSNFSSSSVFRH